mmetsp:Transcript_33811/g.70278  ORF Transcript_33811/g.70278 Transcript_33811/m.70278 type:complete len:181 (+) Transcript_33811:473-1015(+)|eukprot:CAMPEP_0172452210 /NCGR_PEP_ID=MMETSP1065-20121228/9943_1 /TAXON_ID=265537 /ORGANISM="Amphiprora paludosa, Strain CCMP125" /LENGTH=180 /DNA_ID=CAMNT_0013204239 /DNA_START=461 /DNA_END=1003 /DNA_ORIENTATION=+
MTPHNDQQQQWPEDILGVDDEMKDLETSEDENAISQGEVSSSDTSFSPFVLLDVMDVPAQNDGAPKVSRTDRSTPSFQNTAGHPLRMTTDTKPLSLLEALAVAAPPPGVVSFSWNEREEGREEDPPSLQSILSQALELDNDAFDPVSRTSLMDQPPRRVAHRDSMCKPRHQCPSCPSALQ